MIDSTDENFAGDAELIDSASPAVVKELTQSLVRFLERKPEDAQDDEAEQVAPSTVPTHLLVVPEAGPPCLVVINSEDELRLALSIVPVGSWVVPFRGTVGDLVVRPLEIYVRGHTAPVLKGAPALGFQTLARLTSTW
jgi:hypothetical protein